jgi:hypothetical protein
MGGWFESKTSGNPALEPAMYVELIKPSEAGSLHQQQNLNFANSEAAIHKCS